SGGAVPPLAGAVGGGACQRGRPGGDERSDSSTGGLGAAFCEPATERGGPLHQAGIQLLGHRVGRFSAILRLVVKRSNSKSEGIHAGRARREGRRDRGGRGAQAVRSLRGASG